MAEDLTTTAAGEEKRDEGHQAQSSSSTTSQNWQAEPPQQNANPDHWQVTYGRRNSRGQNRYRGHQQPPGFGRGRLRNDQEQQQFNDNLRPNQQHSGNYRPNQQHSGNYRPNQQHSDNYRPNLHNAHNRGYHHNQAPRYQKAPEEHPQQGEMRENHSRERENRQEKAFSPKSDERESNANDSNDRPGKESESKDTRDSMPQGGQEVDIDLVSLRSSIEEVAQCPVCLELLKPPVTLCVNGHGTCTACKRTLSECSTCRQPYLNNEPRVLNEILQKIPKVCEYYDAGCRELGTDDHEFYCGFGTVKCIFQDEDKDFCNWEGFAKEFKHHVYRDCPFKYTTAIALITKCRFRKFKDHCREKSFLIDLEWVSNECRDQLFIFTHAKINGTFCLYINHFPLTKPKVTFYFTLSFGNSAGKVLYQYKLKATTKTTLDREVNLDDNEYYMRVPLVELEKLVDEEGDLYVNYEISTEPV